MPNITKLKVIEKALPEQDLGEFMTRMSNKLERGELTKPSSSAPSAYDRIYLRHNPGLVDDMPPIERDAERWVARERSKELKRGDFGPAKHHPDMHIKAYDDRLDAINQDLIDDGLMPRENLEPFDADFIADEAIREALHKYLLKHR